MLPTSTMYYHPSKYQIIPVLIHIYSNSVFPRTAFWWNALRNVLVAPTIQALRVAADIMTRLSVLLLMHRYLNWNCFRFLYPLWWIWYIDAAFQKSCVRKEYSPRVRTSSTSPATWRPALWPPSPVSRDTDSSAVTRFDVRQWVTGGESFHTVVRKLRSSIYTS